jgi:hypothetical protein
MVSNSGSGPTTASRQQHKNESCSFAHCASSYGRWFEPPHGQEDVGKKLPDRQLHPLS